MPHRRLDGRVWGAVSARDADGKGEMMNGRDPRETEAYKKAAVAARELATEVDLFKVADFLHEADASGDYDIPYLAVIDVMEEPRSRVEG